MDMALFKRAIDSMAIWTDFIWLHHFGDPLLDKDIFQRISYVRSAGVHSGISTNPQSLTPDRSKKLVDAGLDLLHISLDGIDQETYSYFRGKNADYERGVKNIQAHCLQKAELNSAHPYTVVSMIKMDRNEGQVDEFRSQWTKSGIDRVFIKPFTTFAGSVDGSISNEYLRTIDYIRINNLRPRCYFPWSSITVLSDGKVVPCCYDYDGKCVLGDLNCEPVDKIWNGSRMRNFRKEHISGDFSSNPLCKDCIIPKPPKNYNCIFSRYKDNIMKSSKNKKTVRSIARL
jgi:radical SAM protein with 4Fe4S-binding SPASM domain